MEVTAKERRQVEEQVEQLLSGQGSEVTLCDLGLELSKPATLRKNVTYIVCGVIFNEQEEVLMVQEAKPDCYKQWYLPAGRVEVGESLEEALRREVKEEAGFDCQPITLLLIQEQGPQWIRFIFLARITGGSMKTLTAADQESLQASWWDRQSSLSLRGRDILRLIDYGLRYHRSPWHGASLPLDLSCRHIVQRTLLLFVGAEKRVWILLVQGNPPTPHLPTAAALKTHAEVKVWMKWLILTRLVQLVLTVQNLQNLFHLRNQLFGADLGLPPRAPFHSSLRSLPEPATRPAVRLMFPLISVRRCGPLRTKLSPGAAAR
uniref:Nudix hydrolase 18 n=1 Tax=Poecilia reticulata TaxID=8081 RepID=A0A3P9PWK9_POERE